MTRRKSTSITGAALSASSELIRTQQYKLCIASDVMHPYRLNNTHDNDQFIRAIKKVLTLCVGEWIVSLMFSLFYPCR